MSIISSYALNLKIKKCNNIQKSALYDDKADFFHLTYMSFFVDAYCISAFSITSMV